MEWIRKNLWQTVLVAAITVIFSTAGSLFVYDASTKANKVDKAASIDYVDGKVGDLKTYTDYQDSDIKQHISAIDARMEYKADKADIMEIRGLIKQQNEYLFQIISKNKIGP